MYAEAEQNADMERTQAAREKSRKNERECVCNSMHVRICKKKNAGIEREKVERENMNDREKRRRIFFGGGNLSENREEAEKKMEKIETSP